MAIRGIGNWTAQYIAMRAMEWPDAFLETDSGVKKHFLIFHLENYWKYQNHGDHGVAMQLLIFGIFYNKSLLLSLLV